MNLWRCLRRFVPAAILLLCFTAAGSRVASAQTLSPETVRATTIGDGQRNDIEQYMRACVDLLVNGDDEAVARGRERLLDPFQRGGSNAFVAAYSGAVARALASALPAAERPISRLNGMIVATRLNDPAVVPVIQATLGDESPSVRFWAARAVGEAGRASQVGDAERQQLIQSVVTAIQGETTTEVLQEMFKALAVVDDGRQLLPLTQVRLRNMAAGNAVPVLTPEAEGLLRFYQKFWGQQTKDPEIVKQVAVAAYQLIELAATVLDSGSVPDERVAEFRQVIEIADPILRATVDHLGIKPGGQPPPIATELKSGAWPDILLRNNNWRRLLTNPPINLRPDDVSLPPIQIGGGR